MGTGIRISELRETHWANFSTVGPEAVTEVNSRMKSNGRMASFLDILKTTQNNSTALIEYGAT